MPGDPYDFRFDMSGIDRAALLQESAREIDKLAGHLGPGGVAGPSEAGAATREFVNDEALLPAYPDVYRITDRDFLARGKPEPVDLQQLSERFDFYWVRFPVGLKPQRHWGFNMIEVRVEFNPDDPPHLRPKAWSIAPRKDFQELMKAHTSLTLSLDEKLEFKADAGDALQGAAGDASGSLKAGVGAVVNAGAGAVFGPFEYRIKRARIDHSATGMEWVFWRIDGAEFFEDDTPELVVIVQVPKETRKVTVRAALQASRYFKTGSAPWQEVVRRIPATLFGWFDQGMPLRDEKPWDLTPSL
jgi:hypothetical protein